MPDRKILVWTKHPSGQMLIETNTSQDKFQSGQGQYALRFTSNLTVSVGYVGLGLGRIVLS